MPNEVDRSLLDRLQALRGSSSTPERPAPQSVEVDVIERKKTPTRDDKLGERLKSLREGSASPLRAPEQTEKVVEAKKPREEVDEKRVGSGGKKDDLSDKLRRLRGKHGASTAVDQEKGQADDTDDKELDELLADIPAEESFTTAHREPDDAQVRALLEQLSDAIPKDQRQDKENEENENDNSDGENMQKEVDNVIARFRDEIELEKDQPSPKSSPEPPEDQDEGSGPPPNLSLPDVPEGTQSSSAKAPSSMDDITARLSALRAPSEDLALPSVPTSKPAKGPKRLTSKTNYTDDDVDSWCTVCLADATLLCLGCEEKGEPYCVRCWREMHVGEAAAFDDRSHKAVQFGKKDRKEKKVALGA